MVKNYCFCEDYKREEKKILTLSVGFVLKHVLFDFIKILKRKN